MDAQRVGKWPTIANQKRENALMHLRQIEKIAITSLDAAKRRGDMAEAARQAESAAHARGGLLELTEARYLGRR